ncbi:DUF805 domain-containing protein [Haloferula sp.]|uniref:DUF805 domain-containing protein n=1 Tax=Haloferula sp. TaxID=2497595 RepID=UPI003C74D063
MITKLFSPKGDASRSEWWIVTLVSEFVAQCLILSLIIPALDEGSLQPPMLVSLLVLVTVVLWLTVAVSLRRLRDRGRSGWLLLIGLVPVAGLIWLIIECGFIPGRSSSESSVAIPV